MGPGSSSGRMSASGNGRSWVEPFDPGLQHTKVVKNGTSSLPAWHSDLQGTARTGQPSVKIM